MKNGLILALLSWILNISICKASQCSGHTCLACGTDTLQLTCDSDHTVTGFIKAAWRNADTAELYTNNTDHCGFVEGDCYAEDSFMINQVKRCMWHENECSFAISPFISYIRGPTHNCTDPIDKLKAKFLVAFDFHCVHRDKIHALCLSFPRILLAEDLSTVQYLTSADFPFEYAQYRQLIVDHCSVEIHVSRGYGIRIWSVFMDITNPVDNGECTMEHIRLSHPEHTAGVGSIQACGGGNFSVDWPYSSLEVQFVVDEMDERIAKLREGFVLRYGRYKLAEPVTSPPSTTQQTSTTIISLITQDTQTSPTQGDELSTTVLIAILLPALLFVMVMVGALALLLYRRMHSKSAYSPTHNHMNNHRQAGETDSDSSVSDSGYV